MKLRSIIIGPIVIAIFELCATIRTTGTDPLLSPPVATRSAFAGQSRISITPSGQRAIDRGMDWLLLAIRKDGVGPDINQPADLSCAAIAGLALLSSGSTSRHGPHADKVQEVLNYVLTEVERLPENYNPTRSFTLVQRKIGRHAELFLSALFLSQVYGDAGLLEQEVREALEKLVKIIARGQGADGTWGDDSWAPVLGTVMGWESLRAANSCGIRIEASAELAGKALMAKLKSKVQGPNEENWMHSFYKDASSIRVLHSLGYRNDPVFEDCVKNVIRISQEDIRPFAQAGGEEYLAFSLVTECLLHNPKEPWRAWYPAVSEKLVKFQNNNGSWSGHHCITDRTFCTAAALLTLQAPNKYLPISDL